MGSNFFKLSDGSFEIRIAPWMVKDEVKDVNKYINDCLSKIDPESISSIRILGFHFEVPSEMFSPFKNLIELMIYGNDLLVEIPDLPETLESLDLTKTEIRKLPEVLPKNLECLSLKECKKLEELPKELPKNMYSLYIDGCDNLHYDPKTLPESLVDFSCDSFEKTHFKDLRLPNLKRFHVLERDIKRHFEFENCLFSLGTKSMCDDNYLFVESSGISKILKRHTLETYSRIYASRKTEHLDDFTNLIKSRFELWSLREEGARFRQAHREFEELFG